MRTMGVRCMVTRVVRRPMLVAHSFPACLSCFLLFSFVASFLRFLEHRLPVVAMVMPLQQTAVMMATMEIYCIPLIYFIFVGPCSVAYLCSIRPCAICPNDVCFPGLFALNHLLRKAIPRRAKSECKQKNYYSLLHLIYYVNLTR